MATLQTNLKEIIWICMKEFSQKVISTTRFDENSDLSTTYLGRINTTRASKIKVQKKIFLYQNKGIE